MISIAKLVMEFETLLLPPRRRRKGEDEDENGDEDEMRLMLIVCYDEDEDQNTQRSYVNGSWMIVTLIEV